MGPACIAQISDPDSKEQFRQMIHDEVDEWVDELLCVFDEDRQPTLMEMSPAASGIYQDKAEVSGRLSAKNDRGEIR